VKSRNFAIGVMLVGAGMIGLVYSMPIVSNAMSLKSKTEPAALGKSPVPTLPSNDSAILGIEVASIPAIIAGISLMAIGESIRSKSDQPA